MRTAEIQTAGLSTGVTLPYVEQGDPDGVPVLMLHGLTDSWRSFEPVLPYLPASVRAFAVTQRGHGDAERPEAGYTPRDLAADAVAFLDAVGVESAIVVGHSMGATVAQRVALDHPDRVRGLVSAGSFLSFAANAEAAGLWEYVSTELGDPIDAAFAREFQESTLAGPIAATQLDTFVAETQKVPARVCRAALAGLMESDVTAELPAITAPTLVVHGDRDAMCLRSDQDAIVAAVPGARLEVYAGAGHAMHWEQPERFAADLTDFAQG
jgi:non-heme chloroperoxidase